MASNDRVIKSYVWHGDKCFFVSTIERDSSAMIYEHRYNETIVWEYDWETSKRGELLFMGEDIRGSVNRHLEMCKELYCAGSINDSEEA